MPGLTAAQESWLRAASRRPCKLALAAMYVLSSPRLLLPEDLAGVDANANAEAEADAAAVCLTMQHVGLQPRVEPRS